MNLDLLARSAAAELRDATARSLDVDTALAGLSVMRRRRAATRGVVVTLVLAATVLTTLLVLRPAADAPPADRQPVPTPTQPLVDTRPTEFPVRVPPLCTNHWPGITHYGDPQLEGPAICPETTPAGDYASIIAGLNVVRPFTFRLPDGWVVRSVEGDWPFAGVDLEAADGSAGLTVFAYPEPVDRGRRVPPLRQWLEHNPDLGVRQRPDAHLGRYITAWVVDLTVRDSAPLVDACRLVAPCHPTLDAAMERVFPSATQGRMVELRPGVTSRLVVGRGADGNVVPAVWLWDAGPGPRQDEARAVLRSLEVLSAREPDPLRAQP